MGLQVVDLSDDFPEKLIVKCTVSEEVAFYSVQDAQRGTGLPGSARALFFGEPRQVDGSMAQSCLAERFFS